MLQLIISNPDHLVVHHRPMSKLEDSMRSSLENLEQFFSDYSWQFDCDMEYEVINEQQTMPYIA